MKKQSSIILWFAFLAVMAFVMSGCKKEEGTLKFDHQLHVTENEMQCSDCHEAAKDGKMTDPDMDKCTECHDIDLDHPSDDCLQCHTLKSSLNDYSVEDAAPEKPRGYVDLVFTHEAHDGIAECSDCHKGIDKEESLKDIEWPDMFTCKNCHNGEDAPIDCEVCHTKVRKEIAPASHKGDWAEHHGFESRFDRSCEFCHDEKNFCTDCHQTKKPRDHIFNWKTTQHGQDATHDRRLCAVCHTASYCSDCHRSQKPVSHARANWMAYTPENGHAEAAKENFRSCNVCHSRSDCDKCHQNMILRHK